MENKKMTQKEMFNEILNLAIACERPDIEKFAKDRIAALEKKSSNKKPTKKQLENKTIAEGIIDTLKIQSPDIAVSIAEIREMDPMFENMSSPKLSAILSPMVKEGKIIRTYNGKTSVFQLAPHMLDDEVKLEEAV